jgi:hypothetical protein
VAHEVREEGAWHELAALAAIPEIQTSVVMSAYQHDGWRQQVHHRSPHQG